LLKSPAVVFAAAFLQQIRLASVHVAMSVDMNEHQVIRLQFVVRVQRA
jgi:hypothetical protein